MDKHGCTGLWALSLPTGAKLPKRQEHFPAAQERQAAEPVETTAPATAPNTPMPKQIRAALAKLKARRAQIALITCREEGDQAHVGGPSKHLGPHTPHRVRAGETGQLSTMPRTRHRKNSGGSAAGNARRKRTCPRPPPKKCAEGMPRQCSTQQQDQQGLRRTASRPTGTSRAKHNWCRAARESDRRIR